MTGHRSHCDQRNAPCDLQQNGHVIIYLYEAHDP